jgi:hypothetical protein
MLLVNKESVQELKEEIISSEEIPECRDKLKKMIEIKEVSLWRAEEGQCCCSALGNLPAQLYWEIQLLTEALNALEAKDTCKAAALLEDYCAQWEQA